MASISSDIVPFPSELQRALGTYPEDVSGRAAAALRTCLLPRLASSGPHEWSSSPLTGSGFPVELTFTTADGRLRYTVEPGTRQDSPRHRLGAALDLLRTLSGSGVPDDIQHRWRDAQSRDGLRYGAWLGGRHGPSALPGADEFKIYVEWPDNGGADDVTAMYPLPRLPDRTPKLRMVAYSPASQDFEAYYRVSSLTPWHLPRVLAPCGLEEQSDALLDYLTEAYGHVFRERLPGLSVGISYSFQAGRAPRSVTLFLFARVFWGGDSRIRERFGLMARGVGWDDSRYQAITAALAKRDICTTHHGIIGFTLTRNGQIYLSIGVRPPEEIGTDIAGERAKQ